MDKKNFEAFTNLLPNKKNAVDLCGQEFIDCLVAKGIYAKDDEFWRQVNQHLEVPDHAYNTKKAREKEEKEREIAESKAREIAETRLDKIETPLMPDRDAWAQRISQFHWSHHELRDGTAWAHMRKFVEK